MMDGLGDALSRFNKNLGGEAPEEKEHERPGKKKSETSQHAHHYAVHVHSDGTHHLTAHKGGQLVHHSEHGSMGEAAQAMQQHAEGTENGGGMDEPGVGGQHQV